MPPPIAWLLEGEPHVAYRTRVDLLGQGEDAPEVAAARAAMLADERIQALVAGLQDWPSGVIASHKSPTQPFHRLDFLADLGLRASDAGMGVIVAAILAHQSEEGAFQLPMRISEAYGGTGQEIWGWALCDAPLEVYALSSLGLEAHPQVQAALAHLAGLVRANGWPCATAPSLGFRGPGGKGDPCPFATLAALKALALAPAWRESEPARLGAECLLGLWADSRTRHPYIFYMGTDFRKLKAPLVWYDLLHVLDVLTRFPWLRGDPRLDDMLAVLRSKMDADGRFTPESVWMAWKGWEFAQKKAPSRWVTFLAWRALQRVG